MLEAINNTNIVISASMASSAQTSTPPLPPIIASTQGSQTKLPRMECTRTILLTCSKPGHYWSLLINVIYCLRIYFNLDLITSYQKYNLEMKLMQN